MILGISTSQSQIGLVLGQKKEIIFSKELSLISSTKTDLGTLLSASLNEVGKKVVDIEKIVVDIGPGGTSSVRTGVAFANGLAYCLKKPLLPIPSYELIGLDVFQKFSLPVITVIPSIKESFYFGFYENGVCKLKYGKIDDLVQEIEAKFPTFVVAGYGKILNNFQSFFANTEVVQSNIQKVNTSLMISDLDNLNVKEVYYPNLPVPITETQIA